MIKDEELKIHNRCKVVYLLMEHVYYTRVEDTIIHGKKDYNFVFPDNENDRDILNMYDADFEIKKYNDCFKYLISEIAKIKREENRSTN